MHDGGFDRRLPGAAEVAEHDVVERRFLDGELPIGHRQLMQPDQRVRLGALILKNTGQTGKAVKIERFEQPVLGLAS